MHKSASWIVGSVSLASVISGCAVDSAEERVGATLQPLCTLGPVLTNPPAPGPVAPGGSVSIQASASCDAGEQPQFRVRHRLNGNKAWAAIRQWGGPSFTWNTTGLATGLYELRVETRATGVPSGVETAAKFDYAVGDVCTDATLEALDPSPQAIGEVVDFHATATCSIGQVPEFQYLIRRAGQTALTVQRDWTLSGDFGWDTNGEQAGIHRVQVRVRALGNSSVYEVKRAKDHELVDCAVSPTHSACVSPSVVSMVPADGATGVETTSNIALTFSEAMKASSLVAQTSDGACSGTIQLSAANFASCTGFASATPVLSSADTVATLGTAGNLAPGSTYKIRVTTGATDAAGHPLSAAYTSVTGFTTRAVTIAGSMQSELGCSGDWQPDCAATHLSYDAADDVWQRTFTVPIGSWEYKATLNNSWAENYGSFATLNGANIPLSLSASSPVKFYYDHKTHWVTDNRNSQIVVAAGSFQSELGCPGDWQPDCLRSWLQDLDGDGIFTFRTRLTAGNYEVKATLGESFSENYGQGGVPNGPNIPFTIATSCTEILFSYDPATHILTVGPAPSPIQPTSVTIAGSLQSELGCSADWEPGCAATHLSYEAADNVWQGTFAVPSGNWVYLAALNDSWDESYGANATRNGPNISLDLPLSSPVKFYYDHKTHWVTDNWNAQIVVAAGSFQSELGCPGDWQPDCLRSWLQDPEGDGIFAFSTQALAAGSYEVKATIGESFSENYGQGGILNGANIPFSVSTSCAMVSFAYDPASHLLNVSGASN